MAHMKLLTFLCDITLFLTHYSLVRLFSSGRTLRNDEYITHFHGNKFSSSNLYLTGNVHVGEPWNKMCCDSTLWHVVFSECCESYGIDPTVVCGAVWYAPSHLCRQWTPHHLYSLCGHHLCGCTRVGICNDSYICINALVSMKESSSSSSSSSLSSPLSSSSSLSSLSSSSSSSLLSSLSSSSS